MNTQTPSTPSGSLQILKVILYILAGLILVLGLLTGISLMGGASSMVNNMLMPIQLLGGGAIVNMIAPMLNGLFINIGIAALVVSPIIAILLFAVARLIGRLISLEMRLARLEAGR